MVPSTYFVCFAIYFYLFLICAQSKRPSVALYTGYYFYGGWSPDTYKEKGLGGSETAAMFLAKGLHDLGYEVFVGGGVPSQDYDGVHYYNHVDFRDLTERTVFDVFIASRYVHSLLEHRIQAKQIILWTHDTTFLGWWDFEMLPGNGQALMRNLMPKIKGCVCVSEWQKKSILGGEPFGLNPSQFMIIPNAILPERFIANEPVEKVPHRYIYTSVFSRGLPQLLRMFPAIKERYSEAELHVFGYEAVDEKALGVDVKTMPYVHIRGSFSQANLAKEIQMADVWFYPTWFTETYCISAVEMMMGRTLVITTNIGALPSTVGDRGIVLEVPTQGVNSEEFRHLALDALFAIQDDPTRKQTLIDYAYEWANKQSWANVARQWHEYIEKPFPVPLSPYSSVKTPLWGYAYGYESSKQWEEAMKAYAEIYHGEPDEEMYHYQLWMLIAKECEELKGPLDVCERHYLAAHSAALFRAEPLYYLAKLMKNNHKYEACLSYAERAARIPLGKGDVGADTNVYYDGVRTVLKECEERSKTVSGGRGGSAGAGDGDKSGSDGRTGGSDGRSGGSSGGNGDISGTTSVSEDDSNAVGTVSDSNTSDDAHHDVVDHTADGKTVSTAREEDQPIVINLS